MNIGIAIKKLRKQKSLNQSQLAAEVGITQTSLSQIESGAKTPNSGTMKKLCTFFEVPELLIFLLATDLEDIPEKNRGTFEKVFPLVSGLLLEMFDLPKTLRDA
ncbi:helix-turn-helix domain-containing protein [Pedobacter miscanthi]|uniref:HTH cro/C1-type domain-containing protein n=1 Tax=Pedobacter miscanthi TaxID=2259170 RepID=A0A366KZQ1_9SPHI|nr:helix-turn-helix transcriptional regulator [Pedobacter miscanthi]RBQ06719.1 hypothetical protein DRW42_13120 [Pedobacter miscanthi]